ncbi:MULTISPECIES: D-alanine--D-alanine ligase [Clostridium]|uniref:D-alanine--D-alanine ligase n=1 Tax=Clostridium botulinum (strain Eklund 17B / Type B) TaxID=935198 RepID=DDL_CLOBB|nr:MULTISPECIES: D-alanine--D-alanine ligase [Clostridium]B2TPY4.1 RecName: Full=D-alanine--D-alanine ligase; AltName: Full=D-Ala-D-Ala ligase; AltName: Full=D-alanylalanine synthetase [Clostridium botulinum B str. Eklund 17B (NRP)]MBN1046499.1 D-alanine--D-alanine ligase [Clostridium botulinum]ACD24179.1 D-alanine--D-alanine ligase [Clostridium botulinum B str. Eklund 17B (NRP)]MBN1053203.1 D-alanine--D-alanine ligase [Clostridium botulinum]MBN1056400.1 D-alanine--D-alanine ligase [Clostridiu
MKVGVIMGGISSEREISLKSGKSIVDSINKNKYEVVSIVIDEKEDIINKVKGIDFALLALHGQFGEDGTVQSVLQTLEIPYSGCGPLSSSMCMDKDISKCILKAANIRTAPWINLRRNDKINYEKIEGMGYPVVVKPTHGGSSVATFIIKEEKDIKNAVTEAFKWDSEVIIEKFIKGDEITCPVFGDKMLPVVAIKPKAEFFDFTAKYADGGSDEFVTELPKELHEEVEEMALATYKALKCEVYSRVDMIVTEDKVPYILEVNTLPGMTPNSLIPKSAAGVNISFSELIDMIIDESIKVIR